MCKADGQKVTKRIEVETPVDPAILGEKLVFPTTKRVAKNRFLKSALSEYLAPWDPSNLTVTGMPSDAHVNMYEKWSAGGFGIVVTGNIMTDQHHLESPGNTIITKELDSPYRREMWRRIAEGAKKHGALILGQLGNAGRQTPLAVNAHPFSASDVALGEAIGRKFGNPIALSTDQVKTEIIDKFVFASKVLFEAGFDGVQLHGAHGYMIAQFLSRTTNKRTDKYGGSAKNRARIVVDIYNAIREEIPVSTGFIIGIKLNSVEFQAEGITSDEAVEIAQEIDNAGLDFIELSGGTYESLSFHHREEPRRDSTIKREAFFLQFAEKIKPTIQKAIVYVTGGFRTTPGMVRAIKMQSIDGVGLGRPITQEFNLPLKLIEGKIQSAAVWPFGDNFTFALLACCCQMTQAGLTPYNPEKGVNYGIIDLTDEKTLEEYSKAQAEFLSIAEKKGKEGQFYFGVVPYRLNGRAYILQGVQPTL